MKLCTSYYQAPNIRDKVDEIRFSVYVLNLALDYANEHSDKRVIVEILNLHDNRTPDIGKLYSLISEAPNHNIAYDFYSIVDLVEYSERTKHEYNPFMYHHPVTTWPQIDELVNWHGVSDVTIGEPLIFECNDLIKYLHPTGVNIRMRPFPEMNYWEQSKFKDTGLNHFWVPPKYIDAYADAIDVVDILHPNVVREAALVEAYAARTDHFALDVSTVIPNITVDVPLAAFDSKNEEDNFFLTRKNCSQRCMKVPNGCHYCQNIVNIWKTLKAQREQPNDNTEA